MLICSICIEEFSSPISLPCGHIFCAECIANTLQAIKSSSSSYLCPTCRYPFSTEVPAHNSLPPLIRSQLHPSIRRVYLDQGSIANKPMDSTSKSQEEIDALRTLCKSWQRRAAVHSSATYGLLKLASMAKERASELQAERDQLQKRCDLLERQLYFESKYDDPPYNSSASAAISGSSQSAHRRQPRTAPNSAPLTPNSEDEASLPNAQGPPKKRRRRGSH